MLGLPLPLPLPLLLLARPIDVAYRIEAIKTANGPIAIRWRFGRVRFRVRISGVSQSTGRRKPPRCERDPASAADAPTFLPACGKRRCAAGSAVWPQTLLVPPSCTGFALSPASIRAWRARHPRAGMRRPIERVVLHAGRGNTRVWFSAIKEELAAM